MLEIGLAPIGDRPRWVEASPDRPCPICQATNTCSALEEGDGVHCFTIASNWPTPLGGWLHPHAAGIEPC
jgi:hypothetical protein